LEGNKVGRSRRRRGKRTREYRAGVGTERDEVEVVIAEERGRGGEGREDGGNGGAVGRSL